MDKHDNDPTCEDVTGLRLCGNNMPWIFYRGVSPFCISDANEDSRWAAYDADFFDIFTDPTISIECA